MIIDTLDQAERYYSLHPDFKMAVEYVKGLDPQKVSTGKIVLNDRVYINIDTPLLRDISEAFPEIHNSHIDIQIPLVGCEKIGYIPRNQCHIVMTRDVEKDYVIYKEMPTSYFDLKVGQFAVFFTSDGHAPIIGQGYEKKAVIKLSI